jgi:hypothetical protein
MHQAAAITALLAAATLAQAQARYEIGYQFDDEPEIVRVEPRPFSVTMDAVSRPGLIIQRVVALNSLARGEPMIAGMHLQIETTPGDDRAVSSAARMAAAYDDLVFSADASGTIEVDFSFEYPGLVIQVPPGPEYEGIEYELSATVRIAGQSFEGSVTALLTGDRERAVFESAGIFGSHTERLITIRNVEVPTNEPVSLAIEIAKTVDRPRGVSGGQMASLLSPPEAAFPTGRDVFTLPMGVSVNSRQAHIRDNRFVFVACPPDLDGDGVLTILDFLAFQNLFDAGDIAADFDFDGELTLFDFLAFQNAFDAGCP